ncbi:MAG: MMPL family transporter [Deltaproteobacteria bacterium]|nr:MMPL family transporter [Deltaproteobacteria bacterium]
MKHQERWDVALRARLERALADWGRRAHVRPWIVIAIMFGLAAALSSQLPKIQIETSPDEQLHKSDPARVVYERFRAQFGREEVVVLAIQPKEVFDLAFLEKLRALHTELEERVPYLDEVSSLINARETLGVGDELIVRDLLEEWPETPEQLASLRERVLANPLYKSFLISSDGRVTAVVIKNDAFSSQALELDDLSAGFEEAGSGAGSEAEDRPFLTGAENGEIIRAINEVVEGYRGPGFDVYVAGGPVMGFRIMEEMQRNMLLFSLLSICAVAILLFALFRRLSAVFLPLVVIGLSVLSTFGTMAITGKPLGIPTQILPSFLLAVGVGGAVHLLVIFFQRFDAGAPRQEALAFALGHSGLAIVMTGLTTAGGLASFAVAEIAPVADLGIFAPVGILLGLAYCLILLPALLAVVPLSPRAGRDGRAGPDWVERVLLWTGDRCVDRPWIVVGCMAAILLFSLAGASRLQFTYDPLRWFDEQEPVRIAMDYVDHHLDGNISLEITVDSGRENGLMDPVLLQKLDALREEVATIEGEGGLRVGASVSIADIVKEIHQALNENRPEYRVIPDQEQLVAQELLLFESSGADDLEEVVDSQFRLARFSLKMPYAPPMLFKGFIDQIVEAFERSLGESVVVTPTGFAAIMTRSLGAVSTSMVRSYLIALAIITPLMFLLLGNLRSGAAAMVPNLAPIIVTLGLMGWTGIPLDLFTLLIGSIAIGLAVDDTIHFMHNFRKLYEATGDVRHAVRETLRTTGHALLVTSIVLSLAFFVYMFASLENLVLFGLLTGFTIITAFVADITVSPALMTLAARHDVLAAERARRREYADAPGEDALPRSIAAERAIE